MRLEKLLFQATEPAVLQVLLERMMGLEPTTFCVASGLGVGPTDL
jgi:hypothetical protein